MSRRVRDLATSAGAAVLVVAVVGAVPWLLVDRVGWPLPTRIPTPDQVTGVLRGGLPPQVVIDTLAVVVWVAWAQLTVALAAETIAVVRGRPVRVPAVPAARQAAARLVGTILLVASTTTSVARPALALAPPVAVPEVEEPPGPAETAPRAAEPSEPAVRLVTVAPRDSWWRLAETHCGDGLAWQQLRDLNIGRTVADGTTIDADTDVLHPGWQLAVPGDAPSPGPEPSTWTVEPGDNLWDIAHHTLAATTGHHPNDADTAAYLTEVIDTNGDRLVDPDRPDHILPRQQFLLPAPPTTADDRVTETGSTDTGQHEPTTVNGHRHVPADEQPAHAGTGRRHVDDIPGAETPPAAQVPRDGAGAGAEVQRAADGATATDSPRRGQNIDDDTEQDSDAGAAVPVALAATALIAAGVLQTLRRRRRAAYATRRAGMRFPTPHPGAQATEAQLAAAAATEEVLDDLWALLRTIPHTVYPALVTIRAQRVTLLFHDPPGDPPAPWHAMAQPMPAAASAVTVWSAELGVSGPARSVGLPLLVTLGHTDAGDDLYINVGACGPLTVAGELDHVQTRLRTMTLEAATSVIAHPPTVLVLGDDALDHLDAVTCTDDLEPEVTDCVNAVARGVLDEDRTPLLIVCHDDRDLHLPACADLGLIQAGHHLGEQHPRLEVHGPDRGLLRLADGISHQLKLPQLDLPAIDRALTALQHPVLHLADTADAPDPPAHTHDAADDTLSPIEPGPPWCEARLLGPVEVLIDSTPVDGLTPMLLEMLLFLATHRDTATPERIQDALWPDVRPRLAADRVRKTLTRLRTVLGDGPDGQPLVPCRTRGGDGRVELSMHVTTDLDHALALLAAARRAPDVDRIDRTLKALGHVRGEPFETLPLSWGSEITQRAIVELQDGAEHAARLLVESGRHDDAVTVIRRALRLFPATEMLYLALAQIEIARGRPEAVACLRRELETTLDEEGWGTPSAAWSDLQVTGSTR